MEKETRQRKPYNRAQCELFNYGRNSVMFAVSWSDKCGLSPVGIATIKNIQYQKSLSPQARNEYNNYIYNTYFRTGLIEWINIGGSIDYMCWGYFIEGTYTPLEISSVTPNLLFAECAMNTPFYQSLPDNGELVNVCSISQSSGYGYGWGGEAHGYYHC